MAIKKKETKTENKETQQPRTETVQSRAFELWLKEGKPSNRELEHWLQAEREVSRKSAGGNTNKSGRH